MLLLQEIFYRSARRTQPKSGEPTGAEELSGAQPSGDAPMSPPARPSGDDEAPERLDGGEVATGQPGGSEATDEQSGGAARLPLSRKAVRRPSLG